MSEENRESHSEIEEFYSALGEDYDLMTSDASRWEQEGELYRELFQELNPERILDAGCGTGGEAMLLAQLGFSVTGVDGSQNFIEIARRKAEERNIVVEFLVDDLTRLGSIDDNFYSVVICRGNTLPHLRNLSDLKSALASFQRVLTEEGILILQWLNYPLVYRERNRLVGINGTDDAVFLRFYDFISEEKVAFNIIVQKRERNWSATWLKTELTPWSADEVGMLMVQQGWNSLEIAADIQRSEFDPSNSKNVVLFGVRGKGG